MEVRVGIRQRDTVGRIGVLEIMPRVTAVGMLVTILASQLAQASGVEARAWGLNIRRRTRRQARALCPALD